MTEDGGLDEGGDSSSGFEWATEFPAEESEEGLE